MGQRKYLTFLAIILCPSISLPCPWIPTPGSYKYNITTLITDSGTKFLDQEKSAAMILIEEKIEQLIQQKISIESSAQNYDPIKIQSIDRKVARLKKRLRNLPAFSSFRLLVNNIEYGVDNDSSFGIKMLTKKQKRITAAHISSIQTENSAHIFYKHILHKKDHAILTISPQIIIRKEDVGFEMACLRGATGIIKSYDVFATAEFSLGIYITKSNNHKTAYSIGGTQGVELSDKITISNYTKYDYRGGHSDAYQKTLYEQLSISRTIFRDKLKECSLNAGYFWYKSLIKRSYRNSGLVISMMIET
jgi:hypothetical protein